MHTKPECFNLASVLPLRVSCKVWEGVCSHHLSSPAQYRSRLCIYSGRATCKGFPVNHRAEQQTAACGGEFSRAKRRGFSHCAPLTVRRLDETVCRPQRQRGLCSSHWAQRDVLECVPSPPTSRSRVDGKEPRPSQALL